MWKAKFICVNQRRAAHNSITLTAAAGGRDPEGRRAEPLKESKIWQLLEGRFLMLLLHIQTTQNQNTSLKSKKSSRQQQTAEGEAAAEVSFLLSSRSNYPDLESLYDRKLRGLFWTFSEFQAFADGADIL